MPTGRMTGFTTVPPISSATSSSTTPKSIEVGTRYLWLFPMTSLAICGATRQRKAITPAKAVATEAPKALAMVASSPGV